jgi:hypothetical protein
MRMSRVSTGPGEVGLATTGTSAKGIPAQEKLAQGQPRHGKLVDHEHQITQ